MLGPVFIEALRAPRKDPQWVIKCVFGGLLSLGPVMLSLTPALWVFMPEAWPTAQKLVVVVGVAVGGLVLAWVVLGYLYGIFIDALNGVEHALLPPWQAWRRYLFAGVFLFLIVLGYLLLAAVGLTAVMSALGLVPVGEDPAKASALFLFLMAAIFLLYGFFPIVFARFAAEGRLWAAFDPFALWADIRRTVGREYLHACIAFVGLWLLGNVVLGGIPYVGLPLASIYLFYMMVVFARIFGKLIRGKETKPQPFDPAE